MRTIATRLQDGQDLVLEIRKIAEEHNIEAGIILSAVGSLANSTIRVPVINGDVRYIHPEKLEIVSLMGTVSKHGCHLHISVSDLDGKTWGGDAREGCSVRTTCELVIGILDDVVFTREEDENTGFKELKISNK